MRPWIKALLWAAVGGGIGFFGGLSLGSRNRKSSTCDSYDRGYTDGYRDCQKETETSETTRKEKRTFEDIRSIQLEYLNDLDADIPDMDMTEPIIDEKEEPGKIRELHPEDLLPHPITEDEFNRNEKDYDIEDLEFYALDEVLYEPLHEEIIQEPDQLLGIGALYAMPGHPKNPVKEIFIENDTMGTLYHVVYIDGAFMDMVDGLCAPEDDEGEE